MNIEYKTLRSQNVDEYIINKSRFLCHASPVETEEEALAFLQTIRKKHKDATHNCYAYVVGKNAGIMRYSDDGEPSGTAGIPMMEVIKAQNVVNCAVVITRYFGGILLGAGGLVRAYSHSTSLALKKAQVVIMLPSERWIMDVAYPLWDKVNHTLKQLPVQIEESEFATSVQTTLCIRQKDVSQVIETITIVTNAKAEFLQVEEYYAPWDTE